MKLKQLQAVLYTFTGNSSDIATIKVPDQVHRLYLILTNSVSIVNGNLI